ncbi:MAG: fibronectin type III domain-containing protein [Elusimicrobia bacterium]|nr:fibronectin type III domain-containing protein [Elusimicrobiota bacterium]
MPLWAAATDNVGGGIRRVEFLLDGSVFATSTGPFRGSWPITAVQNGTHTWCARAFDLEDNSAVSSTVTVHLKIDDARFVSQTVPAKMVAGRVYPVSVAMRNTGSVPWTRGNQYKLGFPSGIGTPDTLWLGTTNRVLLSTSDSVVNGEDKIFAFTVKAPTTTGNYNFQWKMVQEGQHWFDDMSPNVAVNVFVDTTPPQILLSTPTARIRVTSPQTLSIHADAADDDGIAKVWFILDGVTVSTVTTAPFTYDWSITSALNGTRTWSATAFDFEGHSTTVVPVPLTVDVDVTNPLAPAALAAEGKTRSLVLTWPPSTDSGGSGLAGYRVGVALDAGFAGFVDGWNDLNVGSTTTVTVSGVEPDSVYYVRVRAFDGAGNLSNFRTVSVRTLPEASLTVDTARAYPVPFRPGRGATGVTFDRTPEGADIRLFTNDGRLVKTLAGNSSGMAIWDLTNDEGIPVASGVYLAIIEKDGGRKRLKIVVQK